MRHYLLFLFCALSLTSCAKAPANEAKTIVKEQQQPDTVGWTPRERAIAILDRCVTIDSHADTPLRMRAGEGGKLNRPIAKQRVSIRSMRQGHASGQYLACWVSQGPLTNAGRMRARQIVENLIDISYREVNANPDQCGIARTADEVRALKEQGKIAFLLGVENGYGIGLDLNWLDHYADRGVTYMTLCHNDNNDICDSSTDKVQRWRGLSPFGEKVVERMNDLGMIVDVSHASDSTFWDALRVSRAPIMASHSSARALTGSRRNLTDEMIEALADDGGLIMVAACPGFIRRGKKTSDLDDYMAHLLHIIDVAGVEHVGIGTDFDGGGGVPGFNSPADLINVAERLVIAGYTDQEIEGILGGNYLRLLDRVQSMAKKPANQAS